MKTTLPQSIRHSLAAVAAVALLAACADGGPITPSGVPPTSAQPAAQSDAESEAVATLRWATRRYRDVAVAIDDGFQFLRACEQRAGGATGALYFNGKRTYDGVLYTEVPDGLIYEPGADGHPKLVGVEMMWGYNPGDTPSIQFLGVPLKPITTFIYGLPVWVWRDNPDGLLAPVNPRVSC